MNEPNPAPAPRSLVYRPGTALARLTMQVIVADRAGRLNTNSNLLPVLQYFHVLLRSES